VATLRIKQFTKKSRVRAILRGLKSKNTENIESLAGHLGDQFMFLTDLGNPREKLSDGGSAQMVKLIKRTLIVSIVLVNPNRIES
jgi:hypothetical protein